MQTTNIIETATFNPKIKSYVLITVAFFLLITVAGIPLLLIWFLGLGQFFGMRYYENLKCQLTTKHLEFSKGVLFKVEKTIPLENIQDLTFIQNPFLNVFGLKILKIETAGNSNPRGTDMKLMGIVGAAEFKEKVLAQRDALKSNTNTPKNNSSDNESVALLKEIKNILIEIKNK